MFVRKSSEENEKLMLKLKEFAKGGGRWTLEHDRVLARGYERYLRLGDKVSLYWALTHQASKELAKRKQQLQMNTFLDKIKQFQVIQILYTNTKKAADQITRSSA